MVPSLSFPCSTTNQSEHPTDVNHKVQCKITVVMKACHTSTPRLQLSVYVLYLAIYLAGVYHML